MEKGNLIIFLTVFLSIIGVFHVKMISICIMGSVQAALSL